MVHGGLGSAGYGPGQHHLGPGNSDDLRFHGSELVMLYDYKVRTIKSPGCCLPGQDLYPFVMVMHSILLTLGWGVRVK